MGKGTRNAEANCCKSVGVVGQEDRIIMRFDHLMILRSRTNFMKEDGRQVAQRMRLDSGPYLLVRRPRKLFAPKFLVCCLRKALLHPHLGFTFHILV